LKDLVIRNWGDGSVVDHGDQNGWKSLILDFTSFRDKFVEGTMISLQERRDQMIVVEDYFVPVQ
jgi:hypothetical protein